MKGIFFKSILFLAVFITLGPLPAQPTDAADRYLVTDLGTLDGKYHKASAKLVNALGQVLGVGYWDDPLGTTQQSAWIWDSTNGMRELGGYGGWKTEARDVNDSGQVVGVSLDSDNKDHAFIWENEVMTDLGLGLVANGINNLGQVVGSANSGGSFIWDSTNGIQFLGTPNSFKAAHINDSEQICGGAENASGNSQFAVWDSINGLQFFDLPSGYGTSFCSDVDESGQVVGNAQTFTGTHRAFLWKSINDMLDLGSLNNTYSYAWGINESGIVVGQSHIDGPHNRWGHAFIWDEVNGLRDLNDLVIPDPSYQFIRSASDVNDAGQIAGSSMIDSSDGIYHAVLLTPIPPEPVSIDIIPKTCPNECPIKGGGSLEVAVHGTAGFDVTDIDIASVRLEGVAPTRSSLKDKSSPVVPPPTDCECTTDGRDGFIDLCLKFDKKDIITALGGVNVDQEYPLTLSGELNDGTPIEGKDCIVFVKKGKKN